MSNWSPKPRFSPDPNPLFPVEDKEVTIKGLSPIEQQRAKDGSPVTSSRPSALKAPDPKLTLNKGSLVENVKEGRKSPIKADPSPSDVVKAFLGMGEIVE